MISQVFYISVDLLDKAADCFYFLNIMSANKEGKCLAPLLVIWVYQCRNLNFNINEC